jgi:hypothetical protein
VLLLAQRGEVRADRAKICEAVRGAETAGYFLLELGHANVAFGLIMPTPGLCRVMNAGGPVSSLL